VDYDIVDDYQKMITKFQHLEDNILKLMIQKENLNKEIENKLEENKQEIVDLGKREKKAIEERDTLMLEYQRCDKQTKDIMKHTNEDVRNGMIIQMMSELYLTLTASEDDEHNKKKIKKEINPVKDLAEALRV
jgi:hypothetical protein